MERSPSPAQADRPVTLSGVRAELGRLRADLARIDDALATLERERRPATAPPAERPRSEEYLRLLVDVYDRGGRHGVSSDAFGEIGASHGYDRRGLGGFFRGDRAPLQLLDERVSLTLEGERLVDGFLERLAS